MKINNKLSNLEIKSKKSLLEKEIANYEEQKSQKIFELGLLAYDKIRRGLIEEDLFREICFEIKKLDLEIYNRLVDINEIDGKKDFYVCECGAVLKKEDKFCKECGKKVTSYNDTILCDICASKIDADSNFCVCCGSKVEKIIDNQVDEEYYYMEDEVEDVEYEDQTTMEDTEEYEAVVDEVEAIEDELEIIEEKIEQKENLDLSKEEVLDEKEAVVEASVEDKLENKNIED